MESPSPAITELERLLSRKRQLCSLGVSMDGYERWGNGSDPKFEARASKELAERGQVVEDLEALIDRLSASEPETLVRWAEAHVTLLTDYLEERVADDSTEAFVAKRELEAWKQVARGELRYVDENPVYVKPHPELYEKLFGIPTPKLYW